MRNRVPSKISLCWIKIDRDQTKKLPTFAVLLILRIVLFAEIRGKQFDGRGRGGGKLISGPVLLLLLMRGESVRYIL